MTIIQINIFICEGCGKSIQTTTHPNMYDDPVVTPPDDEWEYIEVPKRNDSGTDEVLACGDCVRKYSTGE